MPSQQNILVIRDDQRLSRTLVEILRRAGYSVATASRLVQARHYLYLHALDLIIIDSSTPNVAGIDVANELHGLFPVIPILLIMDNPLDDLALTEEKIGVRTALVKPIDPASIMAHVDKILASQ